MNHVAEVIGTLKRNDVRLLLFPDGSVVLTHMNGTEKDERLLCAACTPLCLLDLAEQVLDSVIDVLQVSDEVIWCPASCSVCIEMPYNESFGIKDRLDFALFSAGLVVEQILADMDGLECRLDILERSS